MAATMDTYKDDMGSHYEDMMKLSLSPTGNLSYAAEDDSVEVTPMEKKALGGHSELKPSPVKEGDGSPRRNRSLLPVESLVVNDSTDEASDSKLPAGTAQKNDHDDYAAEDEASSNSSGNLHGMPTPGVNDSRSYVNEDQFLGGFDEVNSDRALSDEHVNECHEKSFDETDRRLSGPPGYPHMSSALSLSTATQTHEVRMPMYLPTFKPATGCTNASDFIVRCFVARLRSGITVVKHGRSRWCKSRLRVLHIHQDGKSLSWKPAQGEPNSSKRPPKLDLTTCMEVRHAWSPDPLNKMFTGTPILRQKCEAANAHKSFALIFPKRTVDITAVTADQCKVLMEGFSALCFRLQVANLAGRNGSKRGHNALGDEEEVATTASVTLTNNSTQLSPAAAVTREARTGRRSN